MPSLRENRGFHPEIEDDHGYLFVDSCMQAWPDAEWEIANRHGVTAYGVTAWTPHAGVDSALSGLMYWHLIARTHDHIRVVETVDDIRFAKAEDDAALLLASQDGAFIGDELHRIEAFYRLGLRTMIPSYNVNNNICGGCLDRSDPGLSYFGERVVEECNRVGMVLDCSHLAERSSLDIIEASDDPVLFSHSNADAVVEHPRNLSDEQILACAENDGVIGLVPFGPFTLKDGQTEWPTVDDFMDHLNHVVDLVGSTEHVGIGTDFSLGSYPDHEDDPWGEPDYPNYSERYDAVVTDRFRSPRRFLDGFHQYPQVTNFIEALEEHGYSESDIANILGESHLSLFERVWR